MYHDILVPLDGSTFGEHALPLALELARKSGATLHLTHVLLPVGTVYADAPPFVDSTIESQLLEQQKTTERAYLDAVALRVTQAGVPRVETSLLEGDVSDAIRHRAAEAHADLVVMATHGYGAFARFWLGSVVDELERSPLSAPLLLVRPEKGEADLNRPPSLKRVLLPLDGSPLAEQIIAPAAQTVEATGAELTLLRVIQPLLPVTVPIEGQSFGVMVEQLVEQSEALQDKIRNEARDYLTKIAEPLRQRGLPVITVVDADESPTTAILRHAHDADLVALATHGYHGLARLFLGSVADKVVRGAHVPVMVWRPPATGEPPA